MLRFAIVLLFVFVSAGYARAETPTELSTAETPTELSTAETPTELSTAETPAVAAPAAPRLSNNLDISAPAEVALAAAVSRTITAMTEKVRGCMEAGEPAETCPCAFPDDLAALQTAYDAALAAHPGWVGKVVHFRATAENESGAVSFPGLALQLGFCKGQTP